MFQDGRVTDRLSTAAGSGGVPQPV